MFVSTHVVHREHPLIDVLHPSSKSTLREIRLQRTAKKGHPPQRRVGTAEG